MKLFVRLRPRKAPGFALFWQMRNRTWPRASPTEKQVQWRRVLGWRQGVWAECPQLLFRQTMRGYAYAVLELAERVQFGGDPVKSLQLTNVVEERPSNETRSVSRYFCNELEDKPWYYDKEFWSGYLDHLVASRFNRFTLGFGLEYDFPRGVTDDYFHFVYPYLVDVPGYLQVRVMQLAAADGTRLVAHRPLSTEECAKNLQMLRFVAAETAARGLQFQLGIWTHAYQWTDSPNAYHHIEGLTPENHAPYCRDALAAILHECPEILGLNARAWRKRNSRRKLRLLADGLRGN